MWGTAVLWLEFFLVFIFEMIYSAKHIFYTLLDVILNNCNYKNAFELIDNVDLES